jgi:superfamily I DNA and/or RNA helicase
MPESLAFDLVIFDEASQICPEDAVCSILRANQTIVVGDPKQLPPTRFFAKSVSDLETDEESAEEEEVFESILDECSARMPARSLLWHYRSQHESLIAFSNHHFYQDSLHTFPAPGVEHTDGVKFVYVPDGRYDRGSSRTNRVEAARVVDLST